MNTGRIWFLVVGLILALLLGGTLYFSRPASSPVIPAPSSPPVATQSPNPNPTPETASPAQPAATTPSPPAQVSSTASPTYQYNAQGQLQAIIYPDGSTYIYQYNPHGDKIRETNSKTGKTWFYVYDQNHHPLVVIDPEGRVTHKGGDPASP